jgi:hypothetical protein
MPEVLICTCFHVTSAEEKFERNHNLKLNYIACYHGNPRNFTEVGEAIYKVVQI